MKILLVAAFAAAVGAALFAAGSAYAQQSPAPGEGPGIMERMRGWFRKDPPSPETMQRLMEGRIAGVKASLKLTPDQEKLWAPLETLMKDAGAERMKMMQERRAEMQKTPDPNAPKPDPVTRLEERSKQATAHSAQLAKMVEALKPLYATFSDDQKAVAREILDNMGPGMGRGGRGKGGWGHGKGHGHGGGWFGGRGQAPAPGDAPQPG